MENNESTMKSTEQHWKAMKSNEKQSLRGSLRSLRGSLGSPRGAGIGPVRVQPAQETQKVVEVCTCRQDKLQGQAVPTGGGARLWDHLGILYLTPSEPYIIPIFGNDVKKKIKILTEAIGQLCSDRMCASNPPQERQGSGRTQEGRERLKHREQIEKTMGKC